MGDLPDGDAPTDPTPVAVRWVVERYTWRADESSDNRRRRVSDLAESDEVLATAIDPPAFAVELSASATWPTAISAREYAGSWQVTFMLLATGPDFTGPLSERLVVEVSVQDGLVVSEQVVNR